MGNVIEPNPPEWRRQVAKYEPVPRRPKYRISYAHLWIPFYGLLVIYGLWQFAKLVSGYRGSFIDLVMSFEGSIEPFTTSWYILGAVIAFIIFRLVNFKPRPYRTVEPLSFTEIRGGPPDTDHRPAA